MAKRTAIIDIGSNSVRMAIFEKSSRFAFSLLHESKSRVRISEGAYADNGNLQSAAVERALSALREFLSIACCYGTRKQLCVATSAVRDAPNRAAFLKRLREELGLKIRVIDGEQEAYLGGVAAANLLPRMEAMTIDIGGGSTESARLQNGAVIGSGSIDLGTVRLKELYFDRGDIDGAVAHIDAQLAALPQEPQAVVVGIGGTFRALAQIILKREAHPITKLHAYTFDATKLFDLGKQILEAPDNRALQSLGIKKERFDVIRPGTLILMRFLKHVKCQTLISSGVGVREGLYLTDLLRHSNHRFPEGFNPSLRYLLDRHTIETKFAGRLSTVALRLFDLLQNHFDLPEQTRVPLRIAAQLAKVGASVHFYSYHKNSQYLVESALEYGYTHEEIVTVAALVRFHKTRRVSKAFYARHSKLLPKQKVLNRLNLLLALADTLLAHRPRDIDFTLAYDRENGLEIVGKGAKTLYLAREQLEKLGIGKELTVRFR